MAGDFSTFDDIDRSARLFEAMQKVRFTDMDVRSVIKEAFLALVDFEAKSESRTLLRNKVSEAIFRRRVYSPSWNDSLSRQHPH